MNITLPRVPSDKADHYIYGQAVGLVTQFLTTAFLSAPVPLASTLAAAIVGAGVEGWQYLQNRKAKQVGITPVRDVSFLDWLATVLGGAILDIATLS